MTLVLSPMTGSVALRHADDGANVGAGETILDIECMKTMWPVYAPAAGVVRYRVELGEVVGEGDVVAVIEGDDHADQGNR